MLCDWTILSFQKAHLLQRKSVCAIWQCVPVVADPKKSRAVFTTFYELKIEAFVMKIFLPLLIIALMTFTVVTKRLHIEKKGKNHHPFLYST